MGELYDCPPFIPLRAGELVELICSDRALDEDERSLFRSLAERVAGAYHHELHRRLRDVKAAYAPFDPDSDTTPVVPLSGAEKQKRLNGLLRELTWLLDQAHFRHLGREQMTAVLASSSAWGIRMDVDFSAFEHIALFTRGDAFQTRRLRAWHGLGEGNEVEVPIYRRLVLAMKLRQHKRLGPGVNTDHVYLKVFKDIPKLDVMMLLPGARVRLTGLDRGKIGVGLISGVGTLLYQWAFDLLRFLDTLLLRPEAMWALTAGAVGYAYKTWYGYQQTKQAYHLNLTQSLYFQNLDSNAGVLTRLYDEAEEQECRTTILAYFCVWRYAGPEGWSADDLDASMDLYLDRYADVAVVCEKGEGLARLKKLRLVEEKGDRFRAVPLAGAVEALAHHAD
jgi:hypothetical protein